MTLLQQYSIHQISSEFFIFHQGTVPAQRVFEAINFSSITLPNVKAILKILSKQTQQ